MIVAGFVVGFACLFFAFICLLLCIDDPECFTGVIVFGAIALGVIPVAYSANNHNRNVTHRQVVANLKAEGFDIQSKNVQLVNPDYYSTSILYNVGDCQFIVDISKYNGTWFPDVARNVKGGTSGYKILTPAGLKALTAVCDAK